MSKKRNLSLIAAIMMAFAGLMASNSTANAAGSGCLPASVKAKLAQIRAKFGPISIISTHRPGARIAGSGKRSYHASCRAVDFHAPRGKYSQVVAYLKRTHSGGVGTYSCGMHHIHIDNGPRVRFHHCVNARGRPIGKSHRYASKRYKKKKYAKRSSKRKYAKKRYSKKKYAKKYSAKKYTQKSYKKKSSSKRITSRSPGAMVQAAMGS